MNSVGRSFFITALSIWIASAQRHPAPQAPPDVAAPPAAAKEEAPGLWMSVLTAGPGEDHPLPSDCAIYTFAAWRRNGKLYSTSGPAGEPTTQCLSALMPGVAQALERMTPGDTRRVWLSGELSTPPKDDADSPDEGGRNVTLTAASHFFVTMKAGEKVNNHRLTQVGRAMKELGVQMIAAYSPQARGRSERSFGTWQGRLPQELRLAGITTAEGADAFLRARYIGQFNSKFQVPAEGEGTAFSTYQPDGHGLDLHSLGNHTKSARSPLFHRADGGGSSF